MFRRLCEVLGMPALANRPEFADITSRYKHRGELNVLIAERTRTKTVAEWIDILNDAGIPSGPILTVADMWADPQVNHLDIAQAVDHPDLGEIALVGQPLTFGDDPTNRGVRTPTSSRGEHTESILRELGYDDAAIAELRDQKAI